MTDRSTRPNRVSAETAARLVGDRCGGVAEVRRLAGAVQNSTFQVHGERGDWVAKFGSPQSIEGEAWALGALPAYGIPVPPLVCYDERVADVDGAMLIMEVVPGSATSDPEALRTAGRHIAALHQVEMDGYGAIGLSSSGPAGRDRRWTEQFEETATAVPALISAGVIDAGTATEAVELASRAVEQYDGPGMLVHTDLKLDHLLSEGQRLTAIIDWGDVAAGDPVRDLARMSMVGSPLFDHFLDGYAERPDEATLEVMVGYRMWFNLEAMRSELLHDGDWFAAYRERIERDLRARLP
jgi:aminoglycoside phosphotransferase (APT) family kinase protein